MKEFKGKIDFLYSIGTGETIYFNDKKEFEKEIHDSNEVGRPIDYEVEQECER